MAANEGVPEQGEDTLTLTDASFRQHLHALAQFGDLFRVMIVGEAGLGKSTLVACLLQVQAHGARLEVLQNGGWIRVSELPGGDSTEVMRRYRYTFDGSGHGLRFETIYEIIDTPGFASQINNDNCWLPKLHELEKGHKEFVSRAVTDRRDPRVHLCIYLIAPQKRPLKELDKQVMKEMQQFVPVMPVIAKADTLTAEDLKQFQETLHEDFKVAGIVPLTQLDGFKQMCAKFATLDAPLAVIASNKAYRMRESAWEMCDNIHDDGAQLGRLYVWGLATCEGHSGLPSLRDLLLYARHFIVTQCDKNTRDWHNLQERIILSLARAHAEIDLFKQKLATVSPFVGRCCVHMGPKLGQLGSKAPTPQNHADAREVWEQIFSEKFSPNRLHEDLTKHATLQKSVATTETLYEFYKGRVAVTIPYAKYRGKHKDCTAFLQRRLRESCESNACEAVGAFAKNLATDLGVAAVRGVTYAVCVHLCTVSLEQSCV